MPSEQIIRPVPLTLHIGVTVGNLSTDLASVELDMPIEIKPTAIDPTIPGIGDVKLVATPPNNKQIVQLINNGVEAFIEAFAQSPEGR